MSLQLLIAFLQEPPLRPGHVPMAPQPIDTSDSSSAVPQVRSSPPQREAIFRMSRCEARPCMATTWELVVQSVAGRQGPDDLGILALLEGGRHRARVLRRLGGERPLAEQGVS